MVEIDGFGSSCPPDLDRHTLFSSRPGDEDEKAAVLVTASYAHSMVGGPWFLATSDAMISTRSSIHRTFICIYIYTGYVEVQNF